MANFHHLFFLASPMKQEKETKDLQTRTGKKLSCLWFITKKFQGDNYGSGIKKFQKEIFITSPENEHLGINIRCKGSRSRKP